MATITEKEYVPRIVYKTVCDFCGKGMQDYTGFSRSLSNGKSSKKYDLHSTCLSSIIQKAIKEKNK